VEHTEKTPRFILYLAYRRDEGSRIKRIFLGTLAHLEKCDMAVTTIHARPSLDAPGLSFLEAAVRPSARAALGCGTGRVAG